MYIFLKKELKKNQKTTIIILQHIDIYCVISQNFYDVMHIRISYPQLYICIRYGRQMN